MGYSFRGSVHYHHDRKQGWMQSDMVQATPLTEGNRKSTDCHTGWNLRKETVKLKPAPTVIHLIQQAKPHILIMLLPLWANLFQATTYPKHTGVWNSPWCSKETCIEDVLLKVAETARLLRQKCWSCVFFQLAVFSNKGLHMKYGVLDEFEWSELKNNLRKPV